MEYNPEDTYTYTFDGTKWTVNDVDVGTVGAGNNAIMTDGFVIRGSGQIRGSVNGSITSGTLTVSNYTITGSYMDGETAKTANWTFTDFYGITSEITSYIMSDTANNTTYLKSDSEIHGFGLTKVGEVFAQCKITGTLEGVEVTVNGSFTVSDVTVNYNPVAGYIDLYTWESVTFVLTDTNDNSVTATYNMCVIPAKVTAELSQHLNPGEIAIMNAIPIMVIVTILMAAVGAIAYRRAD